MRANEKLSADTRLFWVGLAIWGAIFGVGPFIALEAHLMVGIVLTIIGLIGLLFLIRDHMRNKQVKFGLLLGVAIVTWGLLSYVIYDHYTSNKRGSIPIWLGFFKEFGYPAERMLLERDNALKVIIYGAALVENTHVSRIAVVCFHYYGTTETMDATGLQKSNIFSVTKNEIPIVIRLDDQFISEVRSGTRGTNYVLLSVPDNFDMNQFTTLRQAHSLGAEILQLVSDGP
jgi:hypothetical protein